MSTFNWTIDNLRSQLHTAIGYGWLTYFEAAAQANGFTTEQIFALASRESGPYWAVHPDGLILGDHGNAIGLIQLNKNSVPDAFENQEPELNLMRGAKLLASNRDWLKKQLPDLDADLMERMIYASYNRGAHGVLKAYQQTGDPDTGTAHNNYGSDVASRCQQMRALLAEGVNRQTQMP